MAADPDKAGDARAYASSARDRAARMQRFADEAHARASATKAEARAAQVRLDSLIEQRDSGVGDGIEEPDN